MESKIIFIIIIIIGTSFCVQDIAKAFRCTIHSTECQKCLDSSCHHHKVDYPGDKTRFLCWDPEIELSIWVVPHITGTDTEICTEPPTSTTMPAETTMPTEQSMTELPEQPTTEIPDPPELPEPPTTELPELETAEDPNLSSFFWICIIFLLFGVSMLSFVLWTKKRARTLQINPTQPTNHMETQV